MHFVKTVAVLVTSGHPTTMIHRLVHVTPLRSSSINIIFVRIHQRSQLDELFNDRLNGYLPYIVQHP